MDLPLEAAAAAATAAAAAAGGCAEGAEAVLELRADLARDELWAPAVRPAPCRKDSAMKGLLWWAVARCNAPGGPG